MVFGNEMGYYLAHRFNASLALYFTAQVACPWMDFAIGQPHNPAYIPAMMTTHDTEMSFFEVITFLSQH